MMYEIRRGNGGRTTAGSSAWWYGAAVLLLLAGASANPLLTIGCTLAAAVFVRLLWRPGEPAILLLVVLFQWVQVSIRVFEADFKGVPLSDLQVGAASELDEAIWLSLAALCVLSVGIRLGAGSPRSTEAVDIRTEVAGLSTTRVFFAYVILVALSQAVSAIAWVYLPLTQILIAVAALKTVPFFLLACIVLTRHQDFRFLAAAILLEVLVGLGGYFSDFKAVFFVVMLAASAARLRLTYRQVLAAGAAGAVLVVLSLFWTAVKTDYRTFINRGTNAQVVLVSWTDRVRYMSGAFQRARLADISTAVQPAINRLGYVDFFAATLSYVPGTVPHTDGAIWAGAVRHALMPRILFPDKPVLANDSRATRRFTGLQVSAENEGTSIGIGYVAESYIDFGRVGMWFPILALGLVWGWMYRKLLRWSAHRLLAYGFAIICLLPGMFFETAAAKQLGSGLSRFIVLLIIMALLEGRWWRWMSAVDRPKGKSFQARYA